MKVSLLTDAPKHNLALMKVSTYYKKHGDEVKLNMPLWKADITYGSWLFEKSTREKTDWTGGIGYDPQECLPTDIESCRPDYSLFNFDHSLGYTFRDCKRKCKFCKVPLLPKEEQHHSIWTFHDEKFDTIELLNNNMFYDPNWKHTFGEILHAQVDVIDNSGNDLRLLDDEKAWWIKLTNWKNQPKFAWDRMRDEKQILQGMKLLQKHKIRAMIYVLMGFDTTSEENMYRCEIINSMGFDPFPMLYKQTLALRKFRRFIYLRYYRKYSTIEKAWEDYNR